MSASKDAGEMPGCGKSNSGTACIQVTLRQRSSASLGLSKKSAFHAPAMCIECPKNNIDLVDHEFKQASKSKAVIL